MKIIKRELCEKLIIEFPKNITLDEIITQLKKDYGKNFIYKTLYIDYKNEFAIRALTITIS